MKFPDGIRLARQGDEQRLFAIFCVAHAEQGYGTMDEDVVRGKIALGCQGKGVIIGLVDGPERIEAVIGLTTEKPWYCANVKENWYSTDLLIYVHPLHRRSRHARKLFRFAEWFENETKIPMILGLMPKDDFEEKERLFERHAKKVGVLYKIGSHGGALGTS